MRPPRYRFFTLNKLHLHEFKDGPRWRGVQRSRRVSLKENISMVKEELSAEEQFFEQAVKTERFVKKYKGPLLGAVVAVVLAVAGTMAYDAYAASKRTAANEAYLTLQKDPANAQAQATLKSDAPLLYEAWQMAAAVKAGDVKALRQLASSASPDIADVSAYEAAAHEKDAAALDAYAYRQNAFYKDLALIDEAVLLLREGKVEAAHQKLRSVESGSPVAPLAEALAHYGVK